MIDTLINKRDNFELIRDSIAQILANETSNQQALATGAGENPVDWAFNVYSERANSWEKWLDVDVDTDITPIVNVWFDSTTAVLSRSDAQSKQGQTGVFNIDCYAYGASASNGVGHLAGDEQAALNAHHLAKLVRNILMSAEYTYLSLRGVVGMRYVSALVSFQPELNGQSVQHVMATRLSLTVNFLETSPQLTPETLCCVHPTLTRLSDGRVLAELDLGSDCS